MWVGAAAASSPPGAAGTGGTRARATTWSRTTNAEQSHLDFPNSVKKSVLPTLSQEMCQSFSSKIDQICDLVYGGAKIKPK